jgi:hypothetical protein
MQAFKALEVEVHAAPDQPTPVAPATATRQLSILFDSGRLGGMRPAARRIALGRLTRLLLEAAGIARRSVTMTSADLLPAAVLKRKAVVYGPTPKSR